MEKYVKNKLVIVTLYVHSQWKVIEHFTRRDHTSHGILSVTSFSLSQYYHSACATRPIIPKPTQMAFNARNDARQSDRPMVEYVYE
jgi:hypothetical protein